MTFAHPYFLFLLLVLPLLGWWRHRREQPAALLYSSTQLVASLRDMTRWTPGRILSVMRWSALVLFIIGLARPQHVESETTVRASGIDIVTALDLSTSMAAEDRGFTLKGEQVNRLEVAKDVLKRFVEKRGNDRIGLVAFAGRAYIAAPLTLDHDFLLQNIDRLNFGLIEDGTAIGSGLSAAVNRLQELKSKSKIVILMTDGQNNAGKVPPLTAAEAAQALNVKVYTIGVGTRGLGRMPMIDPFGRKRYRDVPVDIDEKTLTEIAQKTGGKYYRADSTDTLRKIYDEIDKLERTEVETKKYVQVEELFTWLVIPGLLLLAAEVMLGNTIWRKLP
jgi:Ca-activated chloride channel family protein